MSDAVVAKVQGRTVRVLASGQVLGGIAFGATVSLGALLAADVSGQDSLSGLATASVTLGAAAAAIPLSRLASGKGRRWALSLGNLLALVGIGLVVYAAHIKLFPLLLVAILMIGMGNAGNLQSRFAATDLARPQRRARDLSVVVWSTTVGGVAGPLLLTPGEVVGAYLGMPPLTGAYVFSFVAQICALALYLVALRPDPLLLAAQLAKDVPEATARVADRDNPWLARYAMFAVSGSHVVMASVMAMTPVHLRHMAPEHVTTVVGITIGLHVAGMYGLSPVFGWLADRFGRIRVVLLGQLVLAAALIVASAGSHSTTGVLIALILLGLGWSAATVAGSALLTEASAREQRPRRQGMSDSLMSLSAGVGAILAGFVLSAIEYRGLALVALSLVLAVTVVAPFAYRALRAAETA